MTWGEIDLDQFVQEISGAGQAEALTPEEDWYTVPELADLWGKSVAWVRAKVRQATSLGLVEEATGTRIDRRHRKYNPLVYRRKANATNNDSAGG